MPAFTFSATGHAAHWNQLGLRFVEVDPKTYCVDVNDLEKKLKVGVSKSTPYGLETGGNQAAAVDRVSQVLTDMGHDIVEYRYPQDLGLGDWMEDLWMVDIVYEIDNRIAEIEREPEDHDSVFELPP